MFDIGGDCRVRYLKNLRHASIIHLDFENLGVRITFRKFENVFEIGAAPGVNRLRVIADHHDVAMIARQRVDQIRLDLVRVLILIDQDELKLPAIKHPDPLVVLQHQQGLLEQVVEIH